jgi:NO-binding membrane sensor protein with MHYT domain
MFRVITCLSGEHDPRLVVLAGCVCFLASFVGINLFGRASATKGRVRLAWLALAGVATGCGIWATHFVAMLAYEPGVPVAYDIALTALSLVLAAAITGIGFGVAVGDPSLRRSALVAPSSAAASAACTIPVCWRSNFPDGSRGPPIW